MKAYYDPEETRRICAKYGIETVEKYGAPIYQGEEMDDIDFREMMQEPIIANEEISNNYDLTIPVDDIFQASSDFKNYNEIIDIIKCDSNQTDSNTSNMPIDDYYCCAA